MTAAGEPSLPPPQELRGGWTLIAGEVNTGKTLLLARALKGFLDQGQEDLAVIDMAPPAIRGIGGQMGGQWPPAVRFYRAGLAAPRLTGRTPAEVLALARANARRLEEVFAAYLARPARVLLINDVSMYLQAGDPDRLLEVMQASPTVVINGYYGHSLGGGELGRRERERMAELAARCQRVIRL